MYHPSPVPPPPAPLPDVEFRPDDGPLGELQTRLRNITYTLMELSICAQDVQAPKAEDSPHGRVASKVFVIMAVG